MIDGLSAPVLALPRAVKRMVAVLADTAFCVLALWFALYLRLGEWIALSDGAEIAAAVAVLLALPIFSVFGLYRSVFRYADRSVLIAVTIAVFIYGIVYSAIFTAVGVQGIPRTVGIIQPIILLILISLSRLSAQYWLGGEYKIRKIQPGSRNVLIYGAGAAGRQLATAIGPVSELNAIGFIDDDQSLHQRTVAGLRVYPSNGLRETIARLSVSEIYLALPSVSRRRRNEIIELLRTTHVKVRTLPGLIDLASGRVRTTDLQPLDIEDLLGREPVPPYPDLFENSLLGKVVLVTGAGGSIGSELCRQIVSIGPSCLILLEATEFALYTVHDELMRHIELSAPKPRLVPILASVQDESRIKAVMNAWRPDVVYHAAAYKHVPLVEHNVVEGLKNNVLGTLATALAAKEAGVCNFVLISTDKAVRPTNIMGASKRLAELILQALNGDEPSTCFSMVRFGNVLGSSGSVVPLFQQQIDRGGPVTVTSPEVTRYFMTIPEAAQLVIQAGAMATGGEVFVLEMGSPVRIIDLAKRMIELSGLRVRSEEDPDGDIEIVYTGLRPGEKMYEELLIGSDPAPTRHPRILKANEKFFNLKELLKGLEQMESALRAQEVEKAVTLLRSLVTDYQNIYEIVDWVSTEQAELDGRSTFDSESWGGRHMGLHGSSAR